jgi:hypothetical protein
VVVSDSSSSAENSSWLGWLTLACGWFIKTL